MKKGALRECVALPVPQGVEEEDAEGQREDVEQGEEATETEGEEEGSGVGNGEAVVQGLPLALAEKTAALRLCWKERVPGALRLRP